MPNLADVVTKLPSATVLSSGQVALAGQSTLITSADFSEGQTRDAWADILLGKPSVEQNTYVLLRYYEAALRRAVVDYSFSNLNLAHAVYYPATFNSPIQGLVSTWYSLGEQWSRPTWSDFGEISHAAAAATINLALEKVRRLGRIGAVIAAKIGDLLAVVKDEQDGFELSHGSLNCAASFLSAYEVSCAPQVSFSPRSNIYLRWRFDDRSIVALEFLPEGQVSYVVLGPPNERAERKRHYGMDSVKAVGETLRTLRVQALADEG